MQILVISLDSGISMGDDQAKIIKNRIILTLAQEGINCFEKSIQTGFAKEQLQKIDFINWECVIVVGSNNAGVKFFQELNTEFKPMNSIYLWKGDIFRSELKTLGNIDVIAIPQQPSIYEIISDFALINQLILFPQKPIPDDDEAEIVAGHIGKYIEQFVIEEALTIFSFDDQYFSVIGDSNHI